MNMPRAGVSPGTGTGRPEPDARFDRWAASYDLSQLQTVLYGPVHAAVLRYARRYVPHQSMILDIGCGTGRLAARLASACWPAHVVGVDASLAMIRNGGCAPVPHRPRFAGALAEQLPFADAVFDLVVATLAMSHWSDKAAGLAELSRVMAPGAILVAADVCPARSSRAVTRWTRHGRSRLSGELPGLIWAGGLRIEHAEPVTSVAGLVQAALVAASKPGRGRPR